MTNHRFPAASALAALCLLLTAGPLAAQLTPHPAGRILGALDIDGDGQPDNSPDSDNDGLPDNWEFGGTEPANAEGRLVADRVVNFSAPNPIIPGAVPVPLFSRTAVQTSALLSDTDGDGLSDFVEVFGLKFIDDNNNGRLDFIYTDLNGNGRWDPGEPIDPVSDWMDLNEDGLPSIGEWPLFNALPVTRPDGTVVLSDFDFDGFVFTDPTNPDTDGDGVNDLLDPDPLIDPAAFGAIRSSFGSIVRQGFDGSLDVDYDNDGLGNGMDLLDDVTRIVDNPEDLRRVLQLFRPQALLESPVVVSEGRIEDLLGADWNGDGLWRTTDVRNWNLAPGDPLFEPLVGPDAPRVAGTDLFSIVDTEGVFRLLFAPQPANSIVGIRLADTTFTGRAQQTRLGLGYQDALRPTGRNVNAFISDPRIWTILYSWRMPGFDMDGNGFIGAATLSNYRQSVDGRQLALVDGAIALVPAGTGAPIDQVFEVSELILRLDGSIDTPLGLTSLACGACGSLGLTAGLITFLGLGLLRVRRYALTG